MQRQSIHDRPHPVLADAVVHVASGRILRAELRGFLEVRQVGDGEIGSTLTPVDLS